MKTTSLVFTLLIGSVGVVDQALSWGLSDLDPTNKNSALRSGLKDIDPSNPNGSMGKDLHAKLNLCNNANANVWYTLNNKEQSLQSGECVAWTVTGQAVLSFDQEFREGYQRKTYTLNDGRYRFVNANWPIPNFNGHMAGIDIRTQQRSPGKNPPAKPWALNS